MHEKTGKCKLYLYIAKPDEDDSILEKKNFEFSIGNGRIIEVKNYANIYFIDLTKEKNKCIRNEITGKYECLLNTIVECLEDCTFNLNYDHNKK